MVIGSIGAASASTAAAVEPSRDPYTYWGWVNVTTTVMGVYTPAAANRGNSTGLKNIVDHYAVGSYRFTFRGLGDPSGTVHVSGIGRGDRYCGIGAWASSGTKEIVDIECYKPNEQHGNAMFTVSFLATNQATRPLGYLWAEHPSDNYDATDAYAYNNVSWPNHVTKNGPGSWAVSFPGLGVSGGDVQVTPVFGGVALSGGPQPAWVAIGDCTVAGWGPNGPDESVDIRCYSPNGSPSDLQFTVVFVARQALKGPGSGHAAYLWAGLPTAASYTPDSHYRYSHPAGASHVTRQGVGRYTVTLDAMGPGGTVKVTAYGASATRCTVASIRASGSPQRVGVRCFTLAGAPANSAFSLAYQR
jgi:hypothetical protein